MSNPNPETFIKESYSIENRMIWVDDIDESEINKLYKAVLIMQQISDEPIDVYINSNGGSVYDGMALYDILADSDCHITTYATGKIFSFAIPLFLVGDERYATRNTRFMVHKVSSGTEGNVDIMMNDVKECDYMNKKMIEIIAERTGQSKRFWTNKMNKDTYFDINKAKEWGIL